MNENPFVPPPAEVRVHRTPSKKLIPGSAQATLEYWDEYRRKERERIANLTLPRDENGILTDAAARTILNIGEFPTPERLKDLKDLDEQDKARAMREKLAAAMEKNKKPRGIIARLKRWLRLS